MKSRQGDIDDVVFVDFIDGNGPIERVIIQTYSNSRKSFTWLTVPSVPLVLLKWNVMLFWL